jgi:hypothetical protein
MRSADKMPRNMWHLVLGAAAVVAAAIVAAFLASISHDGLGYPYTEVRQAALTGATLVALAYAASNARRRH